MADNLPDQKEVDDSKLKELEQDLQNLEKRAQSELSQNQSSQRSSIQTAQPQTSTQSPDQGVQQQSQQTQQQTKQSQQPTSNTPPPQNPPPNVVNKPPSNSGSGMKKVMWIAVFILGLSLMGIVGYYLGTQQAEPAQKTPVPTLNPTPTATESPRAGWQTYESEDGWSMMYPEEVEVRENGVVTFMMFGPTQEEGTEFYDGISVSIRYGALGGLSLMEFVDQKASEAEDDEISSLREGPTPVTIAGLNGYTLTVEGLGIFDYYYLPAGERNYLEIVDATQDPEGEGFEDTVEQMLESLEIEAPTEATMTATPTPTSGF